MLGRYSIIVTCNCYAFGNTKKTPIGLLHITDNIRFACIMSYRHIKSVTEMQKLFSEWTGGNVSGDDFDKTT